MEKVSWGGGGSCVVGDDVRNVVTADRTPITYLVEWFSFSENVEFIQCIKNVKLSCH
jgi:hypothetical protein